MTERQCAHLPCTCTVAAMGDYCSDRCSQLHAAGALEGCLCGHDGCDAMMRDRDTAGAEDESTDSDADASLGPGDPRRRGGTAESGSGTG